MIDLSKFDEQYEKEEIIEFDEIPDGKYNVNVDKVELSESKAGKPMLKWTFKIIAGDFKGRKMWKYNMIEAEKLSWLKKDLAKAGMKLAKLSELEGQLESLLDTKLEITKKTKNDFDAIYINAKIEIDDSLDMPF